VAKFILADRADFASLLCGGPISQHGAWDIHANALTPCNLVGSGRCKAMGI
jgi:hypothetical protein